LNNPAARKVTHLPDYLRPTQKTPQLAGEIAQSNRSRGRKPDRCALWGGRKNTRTLTPQRTVVFRAARCVLGESCSTKFFLTPGAKPARTIAQLRVTVGILSIQWIGTGIHNQALKWRGPIDDAAHRARQTVIV
jgi:hypothetical protein